MDKYRHLQRMLHSPLDRNVAQGFLLRFLRLQGISPIPGFRQHLESSPTALLLWITSLVEYLHRSNPQLTVRDADFPQELLPRRDPELARQGTYVPRDLITRKSTPETSHRLPTDFLRNDQCWLSSCYPNQVLELLAVSNINTWVRRWTFPRNLLQGKVVTLSTDTFGALEVEPIDTDDLMDGLTARVFLDGDNVGLNPPPGVIQRMTLAIRDVKPPLFLNPTPGPPDLPADIPEGPFTIYTDGTRRLTNNAWISVFLSDDNTSPYSSDACGVVFAHPQNTQSRCFSYVHIGPIHNDFITHCAYLWELVALVYALHVAMRHQLCPHQSTSVPSTICILVTS
jgi:hypothetical protein